MPTNQVQKEVSATSMDDILHDLAVLHSASTQGEWVKGDTTHDTVIERDGGKKQYHIASFHHASDAAFVDACHRWVPSVLAEVQRLQKIVSELESKK